MAFVSETEAVSTAGFFQRSGVINQKDGIVDIVFSLASAEGYLYASALSGQYRRFMARFVRSGIDGGVQPVLLAVDTDHGLVDRDPIR